MDEPTHTLIQISDPHVDATGDPARYGTDTLTTVQSALDRLVESGVRPDAVVFSGDLAEHGAPAEYRRLRAVLDPVAARLGVPFVYVAGNHDDRAVLRSELLDDGSGSTEPLDHVVRLGGLRVVVLDSTVPGLGYGELTAAQLEWLRAELAAPAPDGTVLVLHHPPLPSALPLTASIELQRRAELAAVLDGTDVRIVLAGHTHQVSAGAVAGIPVFTCGGIASTADALSPPGGSRLVAEPGIARIDLFADAVIATAVPVATRTIAELDGADLTTMVARFRAALP